MQAPPITPVHSGQPPHKFVSGTELINTSISEPCASPWATQAPPDPHSLDRLAAMHDKGSKPQVPLCLQRRVRSACSTHALSSRCCEVLELGTSL